MRQKAIKRLTGQKNGRQKVADGRQKVADKKRQTAKKRKTAKEADIQRRFFYKEKIF